MSPVFSHGALRLYLLHLLDEQPRHGYEIIRALEDRFLGMYTPSAGTIYPRLSALTDDGLIEHDVIGGRKVYKLTDAGRAELRERRPEIDAVVRDAARSAREIAREIREDVRAGVRDLRRELKEATRDVRREASRAVRDSARDAARDARDTSRMEREIRTGVTRRERVEVVVRPSPAGGESDDLRVVLKGLRRDLEAFVGDVLAAARRHRLDADRVRLVREALLDAREAVIEALDGNPQPPPAQPRD